jgi:hypothetical protein
MTTGEPAAGPQGQPLDKAGGQAGAGEAVAAAPGASVETEARPSRTETGPGLRLGVDYW